MPRARTRNFSYSIVEQAENAPQLFHLHNLAYYKVRRMRCVSYAAPCKLSLTFFVATILPAAGQTTEAPSTARALFLRRLATAAIERTHRSVCYDPSNMLIPYSGGDIPANTGVCTDEVIRSFSAVGIYLQKEAHEDMLRNFDAYQIRRDGAIPGLIPASITGASPI
jgi:hypothetical protein